MSLVANFNFLIMIIFLFSWISHLFTRVKWTFKVCKVLDVILDLTLVLLHLLSILIVIIIIIVIFFIIILLTFLRLISIIFAFLIFLLICRNLFIWRRRGLIRIILLCLLIQVSLLSLLVLIWVLGLIGIYILNLYSKIIWLMSISRFALN